MALRRATCRPVALLLAALLAAFLPPGVDGSCFFSQLLGVSYCSSFTLSNKGPPPSPVFLSTPAPAVNGDDCLCTAEVNPYCDASTGEELGPNLGCTLCAGYEAKNLIPCIALGTVNQPEVPAKTTKPLTEPTTNPQPSLPCICGESDKPVCDAQTGSFLAKNGCLAVCDGAALGSFVLCSQFSEDVVTEAPTPRPTPSPTQAPTEAPMLLPPVKKACSDDAFHSGEVTGFAACTHLLSKCGSTATVSAPSMKLPVQPLCSQEIQPACFDAAMDFAIRSPECFVFLTVGTDKCSTSEARAVFNQDLTALCSPL